jgi:transcriptional regulator with XRE-family HTH domain
MRIDLDSRVIRQAVSEQLRKEIRARGLTATHVAAVLGVSRESLHRYLSGRAMPSVEVLARLTRIFEMTIALGGVELSPSEHSHAHIERPLFLRASKARAEYQCARSVSEIAVCQRRINNLQTVKSL